MSIVTPWLKLYELTNEWLDKATKKGTWSKGDQEWYDATKRFNPFIDMYRDRYEREHYLRNNDLDYSDIRQPWNLPGGSDFGHVASYTLNYVSDNIRKLYR